jgi:serine/threonine-protein kinase
MGLSFGGWCFLGALVYFVYFGVEAELRKRGAPSWLRIVNPIVETTLPWTAMWLIAVTQGAEYALGSWVPPILFSCLVIASLVRLRPLAPLLMAVSGAVVMLTLYFSVVRGLLPVSSLDAPLYAPPMQFVRAVTLVGGGALAVLVVRALRSVFGRAEREVRREELFGKYQLERTIAAGGMGTVLEARYCPEGGFERRVAVKRIHPHLARQRRFVDAFRRESELSSLLAHPNVVQVFDFGRAQDTFFLAMEYVDGMTLGTLMTRMRAARIDLDPRVVAHVGREILAGLSYSHAGARDEKGAPLRLIHRDLCPQNVLLSKNGELKISDFGVARAMGDLETVETKTVVGHMAYMAPEQARALPIDERCDLFALGVILWELLVGRPLFDRGSDGATMMALVSDPVPPPSSVRRVDPAWDAFLARAVERHPPDRYRSALEMATALDALADARDPMATSKLAELVTHAMTHFPPPAEEDSMDEDATRALDRAPA